MLMSHPYLRVYFGRDDEHSPVCSVPTDSPPKRVTVCLGDILPTLLHATRLRRAWVRDFDDDQVTISSDLHEVLQAYEELRPAA